jgi:hypothetical protein
MRLNLLEDRLEDDVTNAMIQLPRNMRVLRGHGTGWTMQSSVIAP